MDVSTERVTVRMMKGDAGADWGFRLQGGQEYGYPLTIGKVLEGGLAHRAGLLEGDRVVQIGGASVEHPQMAENVISECGNTLDIVVERPATRIWKPQVIPVNVPPNDMTSPPVRYSLAHHHAPQEYSAVGSAHNVQPRPFGQPQQPVHQQSYVSTTNVSDQYTSPHGLKSKSKVEEYLQKTGGLFGTDPKLAPKVVEPVFLRSETLRLIKESESLAPSSPTVKGEKGVISDAPGGRTTVGGAAAAPVCDHCGRLIHGLFCTVNGKTLHGECFKCSTCGSLLKNVGYFTINDKLYCEVHARQQREQQSRGTFTGRPNIPKLGSRDIPIQYQSTGQDRNGSAYQYYKTTTTSSTVNQQQPYSISTVTPSENQERPLPPPPRPPPPSNIKVAAPSPPSATITAPPAAAPVPNVSISAPPLPPAPPPSSSNLYYSNYNKMIRTAPKNKPHKASLNWPPAVSMNGQQNEVKNWKVSANLSSEFGPGCRDFEDDERRLMSYRTDRNCVERISDGMTGINEQNGTSGHNGKEVPRRENEQNRIDSLNEKCGLDEKNDHNGKSGLDEKNEHSEKSGHNEKGAHNGKSAQNETHAQNGHMTMDRKDKIQEWKNCTEVKETQENPPAKKATRIEETNGEKEKQDKNGGYDVPEYTPSETSPSTVQLNQLDHFESLPSFDQSPQTTSIEVSDFLSRLITSVAEAATVATVNGGFQKFNDLERKLEGHSSIKGTTEQQWASDGKAPSGKTPAQRGRGILKHLNEAPRIPICEACNREIRGPFVLALGKCWCPEHFVCASAQCQRKLLDIGFIEENGLIYCEGCYEKYFAPVCSKCSRSIIGDCLTALDRQWHPECFVCTQCRTPFGSTSFFVENGQPYCERDWNHLFTTKCHACQCPIEAGDRWVEALGNAYHSDCFNCSVCQRNLEGQSFYAKAGRPYCKAHA